MAKDRAQSVCIGTLFCDIYEVFLARSIGVRMATWQHAAAVEATGDFKNTMLDSRYSRFYQARPAPLTAAVVVLAVHLLLRMAPSDA